MVMGYIKDQGEFNQLAGRVTRANKPGCVFVVAPHIFNNEELNHRLGRLMQTVNTMQIPSVDVEQTFRLQILQEDIEAAPVDDGAS